MPASEVFRTAPETKLPVGRMLSRLMPVSKAYVANVVSFSTMSTRSELFSEGTPSANALPAPSVRAPAIADLTRVFIKFHSPDVGKIRTAPSGAQSCGARCPRRDTNMKFLRHGKISGARGRWCTLGKMSLADSIAE